MGAVSGGLRLLPTKEALPFWPGLSCTFYSGELGTFGNTDDILAPASCLESNVRFNFDRLFEKQTYQAGSPDDPLCLEPQAPVPTCLGLTSFWQHDYDGELTGRKDRLKMLRNTLPITVVVFGIAATVAWSAFLGFALLRAFEFLL